MRQEVEIPKEVCLQVGLLYLSDDEAPLILTAHEAEVEGATAIGPDVATVGGYKTEAGAGRLLSVRLGCRENRLDSSCIHQEFVARLGVFDERHLGLLDALATVVWEGGH